MKVSDFDYELPARLIAQDPLPHRDESRLMVVGRGGGVFSHGKFKDIVDYLCPGDVLVLNDTKVIPARLEGVREDTGGRVEVLLLREAGEGLWEALVKPGRRARLGSRLVFGEGVMVGTLLERTGAGGRLIRFECPAGFREAIEKLGKMPLPPYIKKYPGDPGRYQTVYARREGSVAAPTAGLHFTGDLLERIKDSGVKVLTVLLHVGIGTFRPVSVGEVENHRMHEEYYEISPDTAKAINAVKDSGGRIIAVGTTTVRCLEASAAGPGRVRAGSGLTDIFIYPGYRFKVIQGMITNFHLPKSTLIMMVSAFAGRENILRAYREAVEREYRFFSFGDAMLII